MVADLRRVAERHLPHMLTGVQIDGGEVPVWRLVDRKRMRRVLGSPNAQPTRGCHVECEARVHGIRALPDRLDPEQGRLVGRLDVEDAAGGIERSTTPSGAADDARRNDCPLYGRWRVERSHSIWSCGRARERL